MNVTWLPHLSQAQHLNTDIESMSMCFLLHVQYQLYRMFLFSSVQIMYSVCSVKKKKITTHKQTEMGIHEDPNLYICLGSWISLPSSQELIWWNLTHLTLIQKSVQRLPDYGKTISFFLSRRLSMKNYIKK